MPADGDVDVPLRGVVRIGMDRALRPRTVHRSTVRVESGAVQSFLTLWFDPVDSTIGAASFGDGALVPSVTYRLVIEGVRDLDDRPLAEPFTAVFRTGAADGEPYALPEADWGEVEPILRGHCAGEGCHGPGAPALGLDLSSPEGVRATAIGAPSRQLPAGTSGGEGARGSLALAGLPIIDLVGGEGRPGTSYLLYKAVGDPHALGEAMPPPVPGAPPPLSTVQLHRLSDWIRSGAPTE